MKYLFSYNSPLNRFVEKLVHYLWLSILWLICCLPVVTMGASTTALYRVILKYTKKEEGYLTESFFQGFFENQKQGIFIFLASVITGILLLLGTIFYFRQRELTFFSFLLMTFFLSLFLAFLMTCLFVYPLLAVFENTTARTIGNALIMALTHPFAGIAMVSITFLVLLAGLMVFPPLLFISPALCASIHSYFLNKIFDSYKAAIL